MECTDAWFIQQGHMVSDPLKVRHTLDCIPADANYLNMYLHIHV